MDGQTGRSTLEWRGRSVRGAWDDAAIQRPAEARVHDAYLCGGLNLPADRVFAAEQLAAYPGLRGAARAGHAFLQHAVRYLLDRGIRQIVDIGTGMSMRTGVLDVIERTPARGVRVVAVDRDPVAHAYAESQLNRGGTPGRAVRADLLNGDALWQDIVGTGVLDPAEPVGLLITGVLHFIPAESEPDAPLAYLRTQLPGGSFLALSHATEDTFATRHRTALHGVQRAYHSAGIPAVTRTRAQIRAFFADWPLVSPGLVPADSWDTNESGHDGPSAPRPGGEPTPLLAGIAEKTQPAPLPVPGDEQRR